MGWLSNFIRSGFPHLHRAICAGSFGLGASKVLVTKLNPIRSGLEMLIVGGLAAGVAYVVGALLKGLAANRNVI
ncbi:MAG: VIT1/CCC1 transporter family protein [Anaerolineales bacterium]|nr:VIT1/CCC1 transporter family protein [Anaerolineales bacterium]